MRLIGTDSSEVVPSRSGTNTVTNNIQVETGGRIGGIDTDFTGKVVAGLGVGYILASVSSREFRTITKAVVEMAGVISRQAGYTGQESQ